MKQNARAAYPLWHDNRAIGATILRRRYMMTLLRRRLAASALIRRSDSIGQARQACGSMPAPIAVEDHGDER